MSESRKLHDEAMEAASEGDVLRKAGAHEEAQIVFQRAYQLEADAARGVSVEPSRGILFRSAAWLALEALLPREAEKLALAGLLSDELSDRVADELRAVAESAQLRLRQPMPPPSAESMLAFEIKGPYVGYGEAEPEDVLPRVDLMLRLIYRAAERRSGSPFRRSGQVPRSIRERVQPRLQAEAASFLVKITLGGAQTQMWNENNEIVRELMRGARAVSENDDESLRTLIDNTDYRENFTALVQSIAPDGQRVSCVGLFGSSQGVQHPVLVLNPRPSIRKQLVSNGKGSTSNITSIEGELRGADETVPAKYIKLVTDSKVHKVYVSDALLEDIVRPYYGRRVRLTVSSGSGRSPRLHMVGTPEPLFE